MIGNEVFNNESGGLFSYYTLGAWPYCEAFNGDAHEVGLRECGDENTSYCVRILPADGAAYPTEIDVDAYGNWCPNAYQFNVFNAVEGGVGSRYYSAEDGVKEMEFAQITRENLGPDANYRTVMGSPSWHHLTARNPGGEGYDRCPRDLPSIVEATIAEIGGALKWGFGVDSYESIPLLADVRSLIDCQGTGDLPAGAAEGEPTALVDRLLQNRPNPFNPTTWIRFSLARSGHTVLKIYDISGRCVRTLVDRRMEPGFHAATWDGKNDEGDPVGSGVYWSQLRTESYVSNRKMIVLK
jgi:hypothetical protein